MKYLKSILISVYVILVIIVISTNLRCCERIGHNEIKEEDPVISDPIERAETIGNRGKLKVTLLWDFPADLDLHILEPNGCEIYYENKSDSITGGFLDVDNRKGGYGAAENIFWENPPKGEYLVSVEYYKTVDDVLRTGTCQVVVFKGNEPPVTYKIEMERVKQIENVTRIKIQ